MAKYWGKKGNTYQYIEGINSSDLYLVRVGGGINDVKYQKLTAETSATVLQYQSARNVVWVTAPRGNLYASRAKSILDKYVELDTEGDPFAQIRRQVNNSGGTNRTLWKTSYSVSNNILNISGYIGQNDSSTNCYGLLFQITQKNGVLGDSSDWTLRASSLNFSGPVSVQGDPISGSMRKRTSPVNAKSDYVGIYFNYGEIPDGFTPTRYVTSSGDKTISVTVTYSN